jgi:hypothetical protein
MISFVMGWLSAFVPARHHLGSVFMKSAITDGGVFCSRGVQTATADCTREKNKHRTPDRLRIERPKYWSLARPPATQNPITSTLS